MENMKLLHRNTSANYMLTYAQLNGNHCIKAEQNSYIHKQLNS